jgi:OFA family oxalate/formate antiporter-like MFS transporter
MFDSNPASHRYRWLLLLAAVGAMMLTSIYQYSWFLFAYRIQNQWGWSLQTLGLVYSIFHYTSTLIMPFSGFIADRYGPRVVALGAALLVGLGFILCGSFSSPWPFRIFYGLGGVGCGVFYGVSIATAIKWFPDRRGLASGLVALGFGGGTAFFNLAIEALLAQKGVEHTLFLLGMLFLALLIPISLVYRYPAPASLPPRTGTPAASPTPAPAVSYRPWEMLCTYQWYVIYFSFSVTISVVLLFGAQMKLLAEEYGLPAGHFTVLMVLFPLANGVSRALAGAISDRIGRGMTMMVFYGLLGITILALLSFGRTPDLFVALVILASLLGGAPFALYPATIGDYYGSGYATTNYGITYTAKAWAGLISGWFAGYLVSSFGSHTVPLLLVGVSSLVAAAVSNPRLMRPPGSKF